MGIPMTKQGYLNLQAQADKLRAQIPEIQKSISEAREKGDLRENAEYHAAREQLGMLEAKISEIEGRLGQAQIMSTQTQTSSEVLFGAKVEIFDLKYKDKEVYFLVGEGEANPRNNRILTTSPMGAAMLNKMVGQRFVVDAPGGKLEYEILSISYED